MNKVCSGKWSIDKINDLLDQHSFNELNQLDYKGHSAFFWACQESFYHLIVDLLNFQEIDINLRGQNNINQVPFNAIQWGFLSASKYNVSQLFDKWIKRQDFDVNMQNANGYTPLMSSVLTTLIDTNKILKTKDADINIENKEGDTALMMALNLRPDLVSIFLDYGADINIVNKNNENVFDVAKKEETGKSLKYLNAFIEHQKFQEILSINEGLKYHKKKHPRVIL